jgi:hypothetical protein
MSYSGSMSLASFYMPTSASTQAVSAGLFENTLSKQHVFHNEFKMPSLGGKCAIIFSVALLADADASWPTASISVIDADVASSRVGAQIAADTYNSQRSYHSTNPIIPTKSSVELSLSILDSGDQVYLNNAIFLVLPIKE